jgi:hypothetical protein
MIAMITYVILTVLAIIYFVVKMSRIPNEDKLYEPAILKALDKAFARKKKNNWDFIYFYFDIHETILYPDYDNTTTKFYPHAKEVLQYLSNRRDIVLALYTCSYPKEIERYANFFKENKINFTYVNNNPEVESNKWGYFKEKPYFNVLFEDKAGFDAERDWFKIRTYFNI